MLTTRQRKEAMSDTALPLTARTVEPEERKAALARAVATEVRAGWHIQSQTDFQAVLVKGKRTSHGVHLFASIFTATLWVPVWIFMIFKNRDKHRVIDVDVYGNVNVQK